jgi:hypothetical protein
MIILLVYSCHANGSGSILFTFDFSQNGEIYLEKYDTIDSNRKVPGLF